MQPGRTDRDGKKARPRSGPRACRGGLGEAAPEPAEGDWAKQPPSLSRSDPERSRGVRGWKRVSVPLGFACRSFGRALGFDRRDERFAPRRCSGRLRPAAADGARRKGGDVRFWALDYACRAFGYLRSALFGRAERFLPLDFARGSAACGRRATQKRRIAEIPRQIAGNSS